MTDKDKLEEIEKATRSWEAGLPAKQNQLFTRSDIPIKSLYVPTDSQDQDYLEQIGFPGEYPFVRGTTPLEQRGETWPVDTYAGFSDAKATNEYLKYLISEGCNIFQVALDLPTQIGYDSDNPRARGEVGKIGVAIGSLQDMETLFDGIPLEGVIAVVATGSPTPFFLSCMIALLEKQGKQPQILRASFPNDSLNEYYGRGTWIFSPERSLKFSNDVTEYCVRNGLVGVYSQSVCGYHYGEAGLNNCQEIA